MISRRQYALLASVIAFIAWSLASDRLPILRYAAWAFATGILLGLGSVVSAILMVSRSPDSQSQRNRRLVSAPAILEPAHWTSESSSIIHAAQYQPVQLYPKSFVISQALETILTLALRDFVASWYGNITPSPVFVNEVDKNIRVALAELKVRLLQLDLVDVAVTRITPIITAHLRDCDQAERSVKGRSLSRNVTESEELDLVIAAKYKDGRLHPAASSSYSDTKSLEQDHLRKVVVRILPELVSEELIQSRAVSVLVKEIVACAVLWPVMQLLKDPDTWNQIIENYGRTALQERKTVRRMRAALDEHASPNAKAKIELDFPRLAPNDTERAFERFVRAIRKTKTLTDARRYRSQVASQLKRESTVEGQDSVYLRRLEMGKRALDQKIGKLAISTGALPGTAAHVDRRDVAGNGRTRELSLVEIMHTASGLSYFMEYMDRQGRMSLVQFWIVVDGFRNPLEDDFGDESGAVSWNDSDRNDVAQISETYMSKTELSIPQESKATIKAFLAAGHSASLQQYRAARIAILSAQSAVLEELNSQHFPQFKKSDLYYKFLATDEGRASALSPNSPAEQHRPPSPIKPTRPRAASPTVGRGTLHAPPGRRDLRRAALSSNDVRSLGSSKLFDDDDLNAGSMDSEQATPLFDDGYDTDPLAHSTYSIGHESVNGDSFAQQEVIENMEAAMNSIMASAPEEETVHDEPDALFGSPTSSHQSVRHTDTPRSSLEVPRPEAVPGSKAKPSIATLGLVNTSSRIGVFSDNDLFPDEGKFIEDEYADVETSPRDVAEDEIHEAAPGDLGLAEAITALSNEIERLVSQESVVDALSRKAELTNNIPELRILSKSKASLQREIRRKELQRQQYIVQESDNSLYGRSSIRIKSVMVGHEDNGQEFALYVIEVSRRVGDQMPAAAWAIARRYSEFHDLHQRLRRRYPSTRALEFPRRRMVMKLQKQFLHNRRMALENYLQQLLRMPDVCRSRELRAFLSQQAIVGTDGHPSASNTQDIVSRIYNSVTDGMDEFLGNTTVIDQLSVAGQNLISAATSQLGMAQNEVVSIDGGSVADAEAELRAFEDKELEPFVKPICDIFLETFELNRGNNWLRGRAVVVVLHQLLGGTVERKIRDFAKGLMQEESILKYVDMLKQTMWPNGRLRQATVRSSSEKTKTRKEAGIVLATLLPDVVASVVGRSNAQAAARRIAATMNNARLNQHLAYTILDEVIAVLFEAPQRKGVG